MAVGYKNNDGCCEIYLWVCRVAGFVAVLDVIVHLILQMSFFTEGISLRLQIQTLLDQMDKNTQTRKTPYDYVLCGAGVEATYYGHILGVYLLVVAFIMAALEVVFAVNFFIALGWGSDWLVCLKLWDGILWLDDWKKGLFYVLLAVPCFIQPHTVLLAVISGCLVIISGMFYMLKTFKTRREKQLEILSQKESYDRFEDLQDDMIEDDIINPNTRQPMSVADQSEILEV